MNDHVAELIRLEAAEIEHLTMHLRAIVERLQERERVVPEPVVEEVWDGVQNYVTKVRYQHRTWTIAPINVGCFEGNFYVVSDKGNDLGEFATFNRAMQRIRDMEEGQ
jgi:hypothetical protein